MSLPKALLILPDFPYPVENGYKIKANNFIKSLNCRYDLTVITVTYKNNTILNYNEFINSIYPIKFYVYKIHYFELIYNISKSFIKGEPIQKNLFSSIKLKSYFRKHHNEFPLVFFSTIRTCIYFNYFDNSKKVIDFIDSIGLNYLTAQKNTNSYFKKEFFKYEAKRLYNYEIQSASNASLSLFVNHIEANKFSEKCNNIFHIPNGVKSELFQYNKFDEKYINAITFMGTMNYQPNIDAVTWFIYNVLDYVDEKYILYIIGKNPPNSLRKLTKYTNQIFFTDFVEDPYLLINSSICFVAPMQNGAGIQNKVIEAMALGKIVILSEKAAQPFGDCKHNVHFLISEEPQAIAFYINDIFLHPDRYIEMQNNAKKIISNNYTWNSYNKRLYKILDIIS